MKTNTQDGCELLEKKMLKITLETTIKVQENQTNFPEGVHRARLGPAAAC